MSISALQERVELISGICPRYLDPPWISDLVRYEKTWLLAYEPTSRLIVCWFRYPIGIASAEGMNRQPTIAIWFRFSKRAQLRHILRSL